MLLILHGMNLKCGKKCRWGGTSQPIKHKTYQMLPVIEGNILKQSTQMFEEGTSRGGTLRYSRPLRIG